MRRLPVRAGNFSGEPDQKGKHCTVSGNSRVYAIVIQKVLTKVTHPDGQMRPRPKPEDYYGIGRQTKIGPYLGESLVTL